jgi:hypothetical protein
MALHNQETGKNLMDMIPQRQVEWEENRDSHLISLLKPRFNLSFIQKRLKNPYYKINLDQLGSAIWKNIDGRKNVYTIANSIQNQSNEPLAHLYERVAAFIKSLVRNRLIRLKDPIQVD